MADKIMKYLQDTFNCNFNHFTYNTFYNMIDYKERIKTMYV